MKQNSQFVPLSLLLRMLRYFSPSPYILLWRTIEVTVLKELAAQHGLDLQAYVDLDLGSSNGALGNALIREIRLGIDTDRTGLAWARQRKPAYQALVCASATALPLRSRSQQIIFSNSVVEHIPQGHAALAEIARVIAPGGVVLLSTVSQQFHRLVSSKVQLSQVERSALDREYAHQRYYRAEDLAEELSQLGLTVLASVYYINRRQAWIWRRLHVLEQYQQTWPMPRVLGQLLRLPLGLAVVSQMYPLVAPPEQGAGLAIIAQCPPLLSA